MTHKFKRESESGLILVNIEIDNKYELKMILDNGASNTTIDSNAFLIDFNCIPNWGSHQNLIFQVTAGMIGKMETCFA